MLSLCSSRLSRETVEVCTIKFKAEPLKNLPDEMTLSDSVAKIGIRPEMLDEDRCVPADHVAAADREALGISVSARAETKKPQSAVFSVDVEELVLLKRSGLRSTRRSHHEYTDPGQCGQILA